MPKVQSILDGGDEEKFEEPKLQTWGVAEIKDLVKELGRIQSKEKKGYRPGKGSESKRAFPISLEKGVTQTRVLICRT